DWRLAVREHGLASLGAWGGVHVHRFHQLGSAGRAGVRLAPSLGTTVRLGLLGRRGALASLGIRAGWSGGQWIHRYDGRTTWRRSAVLVGVELGLGWDVPWRRAS
ncbi:MAG: hypothetical protein KDK70_32685, partial [Myxococcales bacterium]|nr:hypothetical protein [Myxococcales bacterium]